MRQSKECRWGIVGAGAIARRFARDLRHAPGARLAAVYARRREQAEALTAEIGGARAVPSPEALFAAGIDAVYVATLPDTHHRFAREALLAGLPVLCEKPVTRSLAELDDLLALAAERRLLFQEAMKTPFLPVYRELRALLAPAQEPSALGPVQLVVAGNAVAETPAGHPSWSLRLAGGALLSVGVYQAFLAVDWLGPATEVQALSRGRLGGTPSIGRGRRAQGEGDALTLVQCRHGAAGFSQLYAGLDLGSPGTATLLAEDGFATIHHRWWNPSRVTVARLGERPKELEAPVVGDGLHYQAAHFAALLAAGAPPQGSRWESPVVSHAHSRAVMALMDQARLAVGLHFPGD